MHDAFLNAGAGFVPLGPIEVLEREGYRLAFQQARSPFALGCRYVRIWAHGYAPLGGCFFNGNNQHKRDEKVFSALLDELVETTKVDFLLWPYFPVEVFEFDALKSWHSQNGAGAILPNRSHVRAFLDAKASEGEDGLAGVVLRKKKRKELGRQSRRMADLGTIHVVSTWHGLDPEDALNHFLKVEASGWKAQHGTALAVDDALTDCVRSFLPQMIAERKAQIDLMLLDADCVAGLISLRAGRGLFTWKIGMDESHARFSPGVQMMLELSKQVISDPNIDYVDSLADPDHPMIDHLWGGRRAYSDLFVPLNTKGSLGATTMRFAMTSKDRARTLAKKILRR